MLCLALLLKHVLSEISGNLKVRFSSIHQKFSLKLLEQNLPAVDIFDEFLREVEQLNVVLAATSTSLAHFSGDKGNIPKSGASSAPSDRANGKQDGGGSRATGSGKGSNSGNKGGAGKPGNKSREGAPSRLCVRIPYCLIPVPVLN